MTTIKYLDDVIEVPDSWEDITLDAYEAFIKDRPAEARARVAMVANICNADPELILNWPSDIFGIIVDTTHFLWEEYIVDPAPSVKVNGVTYVIPVEEKISLGAYIDTDQAQKSGERVLANVLAILCRPPLEDYDPELTEERAAMFGKLNMTQVQPLLAFFLHCKNVLDRHTTAFTNLAEVAESLPQSIAASLRLGGGINLWQIWRIIKFGILTALLRRRLRKLSPSYNTFGIKIKQKKRKGN